MDEVKASYEELAERVAQFERCYSEQKFLYGALAENSRDVILFVRRHDGRILEANAAASAYGYNREELLGLTIRDLRATETQDLLQEQMSEADGSGTLFETVHRRRDGTFFPVEVSSVGATIDGTRILVSQVRDISERKRVEAAFLSENEFNRLVIENAGQGICVCHEIQEFPYVRFTVWNECMALITGYSMEEINRSGWYQSMYPDPAVQERAILRMRSMRVGDDIQGEEWEITRSDGQKRQLHITTRLCSSSKGEVHVLGVMNDITDRKQAEVALQRSEALYHDLVETAQDLIWQCDAEGRYTYLNPAWESVFGYRIDEMLGKKFTDFQDPEMAARDLELFACLVQGGLVKGYETTHHAKNGCPIHLVFNAKYIRDAQGQVVGTQGTAYDITERKLAEAEIREKESMYKLLFEAANDGIFIQDATGFRDCNQRGAQMYGLTKEEIIGRSPADFSPERQPDGRLSSEVAEEKIRLALNGVPQAFEWRPIRADGIPFDVEITLSRLELGGVMCLQAIVRDITERKQTEEALRISEEKFKVLAEQSITGICLIQDGRFAYVNPRLAEILDFKQEEMLGLPVLDLVAEPDREKVRENLRKRLSGEAPYMHYTFHALKKGGSKVTAEVHGSSMLYLERPAIIATMLDITQRERAEAEKEKLEAQNRQLQKSESLGRMAGAIAHHFNNQLQTVLLDVEMALGELPGATGRSAEFLTDALQAIRQASEVSELMLTYLGQTIAKHAPVDLSEICRRNLPMLRATMPKNVMLEFEVHSSNPVFNGNADQIQQLLANLVTNAWEAGGSTPCVIRLSVKTASASDISETHRFPLGWQTRHEAYACLEVADTGSGIAYKDIEKIFDPFFSSKFSGRGMGLAVVLGIVRAHEGVITIDSEPGRGSIFRVYFPLTAVAEFPRSPENAPKTLEIQEGGTVLLVEDEEMVRRVAASMLARLGFTVLAVKDGVEALEIFRQHVEEIRLVLCDLTMPRMNGWETLTALRQIAPGIPVILASGYSEAQMMDGDHPELPQACLRKPYGKDQLNAAIRQASTKAKS